MGRTKGNVSSLPFLLLCSMKWFVDVASTHIPVFQDSAATQNQKIILNMSSQERCSRSVAK